MTNRGLIYLIFSFLMASHFVASRTIIDSTKKVKTELCTPINISVVLTSWHPVCITLHWACGHRQRNGEWSYVNLSSLEKLNKDNNKQFEPDELNSFRITYSAYNTRYRFIQEVPPWLNRTNIDNLQPNTKYALTISAVSTNDQIGVISQDVDFVSPAIVVPNTLLNPNDRFYNSFASLRLDTDDTLMKPGEVMVVILVLCAWLYIIFHFIKKWGKIRSIPGRSLERTNQTSQIRTGKSLVPTDSIEFSNLVDADPLNGVTSVATKSRLQSLANVTGGIPKLQMSESHNSLHSEHQSLLAVNSCKHHLSVLSPRPRLNSVFLTSPSRRNSFMPDENRLPRRYKSAEDLQSLVLEITNVQRQQRKHSQISIKEADHLENCTLLNNTDSNNQTLKHASAYSTHHYSGLSRGSICAPSRSSNGAQKFTDLATIAMAASTNQLNQLSRIGSPSHSKSSSSGRELGIGSEPKFYSGSSGTCTTCTGTCSTANSAGTNSLKQPSTQPRQKNSIGIQVVDSSDSNHSTQATLASCEREIESSSTNCAYCRRRMSNCDECTHCNGLNMSNLANRNLILMQSKSFIHNQTCSSENSSFENPCTSSITNLNASFNNSPGNGSQPCTRSSQQCLFQISEATDDIKHIDED